MKTFKHSGAIGDIIYSLPVIKALGGGILYLNVNKLGKHYLGFPTSLEIKKYNSLKPLLLAQDYIAGVSIWTGEPIDYDLDEFRSMGDLARTNLAELHTRAFDLPKELINKKWLDNIEPIKKSKVIMHRSPRYHGNLKWGELIKKHRSEILFVGFQEEYDSFIKDFNCSDIPFYKVTDMLELAKIIAGCELFIGNQSSPFAISEGLHKKNILEICSYCPNCNFNREGHNGN